MWRMTKKITGCARSAVMLDGGKLKHVDIFQGVARGYRLSPNLFKTHIDEPMVAVEVARQ